MRGLSSLLSKSAFIACILSLSVFVSLQSGSADTLKKARPVPVKEGEQIYNLATESGKTYSCMKKNSTISAGKLSKDLKKFTALDLEYKTKIAAYKLKAKLAKAKKNLKAVQKFNKLASDAKLEISSMKVSCGLAFNCSVQTESKEFSLTENGEIEFDLAASTNCSEAIHYIITGKPSFGTIKEITASKILYSAGFNTGSSKLSFKACVNSLNKCSENSVLFNVSAGEKVGRNDALTPYRRTLTRAEAKQLIKKIALNDHNFLTDDLKSGDNYSLDAIVNKLLDDSYTTPDLKPMLEMMRDTDYGFYKGARDLWSNPVLPLNQKFDTKDQEKAGLETVISNYDKGFDPGAHWFTMGGVNAADSVYVRGRYLSPLHTQMTNLWMGHFGTAIHNMAYGSEYWIRDYIKLINDNALGNFKTMVIGSTPTSCLNGLGGGIICDAATNYWMSNIYNTYTAPNQNFARELMEIYLLGPIDQYTGEANYTEDDIVAATAYTSGYKQVSYASTTGFKPEPDYAVTRYKVEYDQSRHDFKEYTAFKGREFEAKGTRTLNQFTEHVFDKHPGLPRFIAGKLFRMLAYPDPSEELVQQLADHFKATNYDIGELIGTIANSEAMYSAKATEPKCIKEPSKIFLETLRNFNIPLISDMMFKDSGVSVSWGYIQSSVLTKLYNAIAAAGEKPLLYDTVFTHDYCGRNRQNFGQKWAISTYMINRIKGMVGVIGRASMYSFQYFKYRDILKKMTVPGESVFAITPSRVIAYFNDIYGVELSSEEYEVIERYLTTRLDNTYTKEQPIGWNAGDNALMDEKIAGLIVIYASMSQSNVL